MLELAIGRLVTNTGVGGGIAATACRVLVKQPKRHLAVRASILHSRRAQYPPARLKLSASAISVVEPSPFLNSRHSYHSTSPIHSQLLLTTPHLRTVPSARLRTTPQTVTLHLSRSLSLSVGRRQASPSPPPTPTSEGDKSRSRTKVEQTLELLKQDLREMQERDDNQSDVKLVPAKDGGEVVQKGPSIWARVKREVKHYYHGFRLLILETRVSIRLVWRVLNGTTLSRKERNQLKRTVSDLFRLVPFVVTLLVPFMELLIPVLIKVFPNMLPSTFESAKDSRDKIRRQLKVKISYAKFLQDTLEEFALSLPKSTKGKSKAEEFTQFMKRARTEGGYVSNADLLKYSKLFQDELTLENLSFPQLRALCRIVGQQTIGTPELLRWQLHLKLRELRADDRLIASEGGAASLDVQELQAACRARGMRALGVPEAKLRAQLTSWLELSLSDGVPPTLLLLSRTLYLPEDISFPDRLKMLVGQLPTEIAEETSLKLKEIEGETDNEAKWILVRRIEAALKEERQRNEKEKQRKKDVEEEKRKLAEMEAVEIPPIITTTAEVLSEMNTSEDIAPILDVRSGTEPILGPMPSSPKRKAVEETKISTEELQEIEEVIRNEAFGKLHEAKEDIAELREQVKDHSDDIADVKLISKLVAGEEQEVVHRSRMGAKLEKRVNRILDHIDTLVGDIHRQAETLGDDNVEEKVTTTVDAAETPTADGDAAAKRPPKRIVKVNELLENLQIFLRDSTNANKALRVEEVLNTLDDDHDGNINLDLTLQVIELLCKENDANISEKQMTTLLDMLRKEMTLKEKQDVSLQQESATPEVPTSSPLVSPSKLNGDVLPKGLDVGQIHPPPSMDSQLEKTKSNGAESNL